MPTYQYQCLECAQPLEVIQSFSDDALTECPECGGGLRKVFNAVGVVFKGSGFYRNDSRSTPANGSSPKEPKKDKKETPKSDSSSSSTAPATTGPS